MSCPTSNAETPIVQKILGSCTVPTKAIQARCSPFVLPDIGATGYIHTNNPRPIVATAYASNRHELHAFIRFCQMFEAVVHVDKQVIHQVDSDWFRYHYIGVMQDFSIALHYSYVMVAKPM